MVFESRTKPVPAQAIGLPGASLTAERLTMIARPM